MSNRYTLQCLTFILIVCSAIPLAARAQSPIDIASGVTRIDDIGIYDIGWRYRSGVSGSMPTGWSGHFEDSTGISCTPFGVQSGRAIFLIHPPWRGGTGVTDQTFHLKLPTARKVALKFSVAMKEGEVGPKKSDGATFRVFVDGKQQYEYNQTTAAWRSSGLDLSRFAGKTIALRFESDPGPKDDPGFDYAFWGDRVLEVSGDAGSRTPSAGLFPQPVRSLDRDYLAPPSGSICPRQLRIPVAKLHLQVPLRRPGLVGNASIVFVLQNQSKVHSPTYCIASGSYLDLIGGDGKLTRSDAPGVKTTIVERTTLRGVHRTAVFYAAGRKIAVDVEINRSEGSFVEVVISSADPYIAAVHFGGIGPVAFRRQVSIPYYGTIQYFPDNRLFANVIVDHKRSHASLLQATDAIYSPLTDGRRNAISEAAYFAVSPDPLCVVPVPGNAPSPFRSLLAKRVILDSWGGTYTDNAAFLKDLATYQITNLLTIAHVWQNGGYDNKLPDVLPAYEPLGGDAGMRTWASTATGLGELFSLHENYVDFYPNAASWNSNDVALDYNGKQVTAWLNEGTGIQSYAVAPDAILKYARTITPEVQKQFQPNASYLDVHSAVPPWFHVDFRADHAGSGEYQTVWNAHRELWKLFREVHGGPVLGEGNNHWYWSGLLDGVEAQFGTGVAGNAGESAPLLVDFDLAAIHPLQFNQGMGYVERWLPSDFDKVWHSRIPPTSIQDQYRMQEVAFGHAGFIASVFEKSLPFIWLEHHLMSPLTSTYGSASVSRVEYEWNGNMISLAEAIRRGCTFDRVHEVYSNGLEIWANQSIKPWRPKPGMAIMPQFGWQAHGAGIDADTSTRVDISGERIVTDRMITRNSVFVNPRQFNAGPSSPRHLEPKLVDFHQTGPRKATVKYGWTVGESVPAGYVMFLHITGEKGVGSEKIAFQPASGLDTAPDSWPIHGNTVGKPVEMEIPGDLPDGEYLIKVGFYSPKTGDRLRLTGVEDESSRIVVGRMLMRDNGQTISISPPQSDPIDKLHSVARLEHTNPQGRPVDFGSITTDVSVLLERQSTGGWLLTAFPRDHIGLVQLTPRSFAGLTSAVSIHALDSAGRTLEVVPVQVGANGIINFKIGADGAAHYIIKPVGAAQTH